LNRSGPIHMYTLGYSSHACFAWSTKCGIFRKQWGSQQSGCQIIA